MQTARHLGETRINLDDEGSDERCAASSLTTLFMWLRDYHCDGLRFDAVHAFLDLSAVHFMEQLSVEVERLSATVERSFISSHRAI